MAQSSLIKSYVVQWRDVRGIIHSCSFLNVKSEAEARAMCRMQYGRELAEVLEVYEK